MAYGEQVTYRTLRARAQKTSSILEHAIAHNVDVLLARYEFMCIPYPEDAAVMSSTDLMNAAVKRIWQEVDVAKKAEGIGPYVPYGRR